MHKFKQIENEANERNYKSRTEATMNTKNQITDGVVSIALFIAAMC